MTNSTVIAVNATALKSGGALAILRQFIGHINDDRLYFIFVNKSLLINDDISKNIKLIQIDTSSLVKRIAWDWFGLQRWFKVRNLSPSVVISLQNTSIAFSQQAKKIIYLHQGVFLYPKHWSFYKKKHRTPAFYKYIYPFFVFIHANKNTLFVVQTQWMKNALCYQYNCLEENVHVIKPNLLPIDVNSVEVNELPYQKTLFYPSASLEFKNHKEIVNALNELKSRNVDISSIGLYLTVNENDDEELLALINKFGLKNNVCFLGDLSFDKVKEYYKSCSTVLYPSYIESFGLPLLEAAVFGKPLVVLDAEYSREVISQYEGALFVPKDSPRAWSDAILKSFSFDKKMESFHPDFKSGWSDFFELTR